MKNIGIAFAVAGSLAAANSTSGAENSTIRLRSTGKIERLQVRYDCGAKGHFTATYVNADPNFLAILPLPGQSQPVVFVSVMSGSGSRYASGKYIWWTKGDTANLYDSTSGENAPPSMTCMASR